MNDSTDDNSTGKTNFNFSSLKYMKYIRIRLLSVNVL